MRAAISLAIGSVLLAACGGDNNSTQNENTVDYHQLQSTPQNTAPLVSISDASLGQHLKNGIRLQLMSGRSAHPSVGNSSSGFIEAPPQATDAIADRGFSETNVHVQGVDEADYAKYDGRHWFVASHLNVSETQRLPGVQIVATDPVTPDAEIVGDYTFDDDWGDIGSLYLVGDEVSTSHVAAIRNQWGNVYPALPGFPIERIGLEVADPAGIIAWPGPQNSKVRVHLVDVSTPRTPVQDWQIELDGSLIDSRKIGNTLYLITRFDPWLQSLHLEHGDGTVRNQNEELLNKATTEELLPHYRVGDTRYPLTTDCLVQEGLEDTYGLNSLVSITAIDLEDQRVLGSTCLNSNVEVMSMSSKSLYLTGSVYDRDARAQNTVIHKFSLAETGATYEATGSVTGTLSWRSDPAFRLHEQDQTLRIVTSLWDQSGPQHKLTLMRQRANTLYSLSELPNASHPDPIGKPNEDIYAVRFTADRAYIVTFQRTDPLYAIDLSDDHSPEVLGELEIPGFATYMHPVGDHLLFTLGHSADERGAVTGVKADLFDVSGQAPKIVNTVSLGDMGSYSEALNDLRALSLLQNSEDQLRIAFPLTRYNNRATPLVGLQLLEINGLEDDGTPSLDDAGMLVTGTLRNNRPFGPNRAVLHDNAVFYSHNNAFWAAHWDDVKNAKGPISPSPIACDTEARPSLRIIVSGATADPALNFCEATVTAIWDDQRYELDALAPTDLAVPPDGPFCEFVGPYEVGGVFDLHVEMAGYQPHSVADLFVHSGICHVQTYETRVRLQAE